MYFDGIVDELRLATTARQAAWLAYEHANQSDPTSCLAVGFEQARP